MPKKAFAVEILLRPQRSGGRKRLQRKAGNSSQLFTKR